MESKTCEWCGKESHSIISIRGLGKICPPCYEKHTLESLEKARDLVKKFNDKFR